SVLRCDCHMIFAIVAVNAMSVSPIIQFFLDAIGKIVGTIAIRRQPGTGSLIRPRGSGGRGPPEAHEVSDPRSLGL
ncbi:MAG TPA: hypothetical protein VEF90_13055, partial [Xanthobacteraceae bacterium]|nr:hypothetical protein [Xanthobacteraceae bacterium]